MYSVKSLPTFLGNMLLPSAGSKSKAKQEICTKEETRKFSSQTSVDFYRSTRPYNPEDNTLQSNTFKHSGTTSLKIFNVTI
jgi:hypothetical protein